MKINGKTYTLAKTTLADIKALAPMKYVEGWTPDDDADCIECETDAAIDVEGMRFKVIFWFDVEDPEDPYDAARLAGMRLYQDLQEVCLHTGGPGGLHAVLQRGDRLSGRARGYVEAENAAQCDE